MYGSSILRTVQLYEHRFPPISLDNQDSTVCEKSQSLIDFPYLYQFIFMKQTSCID